MNRKKAIIYLLVVAGITTLWGFTRADEDPVQKIAASLQDWLSTRPQEKVYLHFDKPYYAIGDTIWFKAYDVIADKHRLSALSGALNVELIDYRDSVMQSIKLPIVSGVTWGDFTLPDSLKEGNYRIRAYTNWMRNFSDDYFFDKTISVVNAISSSVFTKTSYSYSMSDGQQKVSAVINYADIDGKPYAGKQVSYEVVTASKTIGRSKGVTDEKGNLGISFSNNLKGALKAGVINTQIKLDNKTTIAKSITLKAVSGNVDVQFFPEGGNLVAGNQTKIAFKAVGADGLGANVKGVVLDDKNNEVTTFASTHLGMGIFWLNPEAGKTYKARLTYADGSENTVDLSKATDQGYSLMVSDAGADNVRVWVSPGSFITANTAQAGSLVLVAQANGNIYYVGKSEPGGKSFNTHMPKSKFPTGIVQFTLFSGSGEPLNERLKFVQNPGELNLDLSSKPTYGPKQKVTIEMAAKSKGDKPAVGSFSIAVTNETSVPVEEANESTILSTLLLTADLKGYIEKPNYYFTNSNEQTQADLDVLMLTQGYRRFEWKPLLNNTLPPLVFQPEKTLSISGQLKTLGGKPIANGSVRILSNKNGFFFVDTVSDSQGKFSFNNLIFKDSTKFLIQGRTAKDRKNVQIDLDNTKPQPVGLNKNAADMQINIDDGLAPFLQNSKNWYTGQLKSGSIRRPIMLNQVVIRERKNPVEHSENLNGAGNADKILTAKDLQFCGGFLANCLSGVVAGVTFRNGLPYSNRGSGGPMGVVLDGNFLDGDFFTSINPEDIETIEVLNSISYTSIYGSRGANGLLIITSKRGKRANDYQRYAPGVIVYMPKGYYSAREFYSPQYDNPKVNQQVPDLRSTIYWKPNIVTDKDGKASVSFFNGDGAGSYRVVAEGIDGDGNLVRRVYHYKVE